MNHATWLEIAGMVQVCEKTSILLLVECEGLPNIEKIVKQHVEVEGRDEEATLI